MFGKHNAEMKNVIRDNLKVMPVSFIIENC